MYYKGIGPEEGRLWYVSEIETYLTGLSYSSSGSQTHRGHEGTQPSFWQVAISPIALAATPRRGLPEVDGLWPAVLPCLAFQ